MNQSNADEVAEISPRESDCKTAEDYGRRIAEVALSWRWKRKLETKYLDAYQEVLMSLGELTSGGVP